MATIEGVRPLPAQLAMTRESIYCYVFQHRQGDRGVSRDLFVAALDAEGILCDGRFYESSIVAAVLRDAGCGAPIMHRARAAGRLFKCLLPGVGQRRL